MHRIYKRLTYANVVSSLALFLVLTGATALAASQLGKNSVGSKQLRKNSVTAAKIKNNAVIGAKVKDQSLTGSDIQDQSLTGSDINLGTFGTVPSAASAGSLAGGAEFSTFIGPGQTTLATFGPFTIKGECFINTELEGKKVDFVQLELFTSVNNAAMNDNEGDKLVPFNVNDRPTMMFATNKATGNPDIKVGQGELIAVAPDGATYGSQNQTVGVNMPGHPGQCFFAGTITKIG